MKKIIALVAVASIALSGCTYLRGLIGDDTTDSVVNDAYATMKAYHAWQVGLQGYAEINSCGQPASVAHSCDEKLYAKLYALDGVVSACILAATAALNQDPPDFSQVTPCLVQVSSAENLMAQSHIVPVVPGAKP